MGGVISKLRGRQLLGNIPPIPPIIPSKEDSSQLLDGNQQIVDSHSQLLTHNRQSVDAHTLPTNSVLPFNQYATREDFKQLQEAVTNLPSFFEDEEDEEPRARLFQRAYVHARIVLRGLG